MTSSLNEKIVKKWNWLIAVGIGLLAISLLGFYFYPKMLEAKYAGCDGPTNPLPCFLTPLETMTFQIIAYVGLTGWGILAVWFIRITVQGLVDWWASRIVPEKRRA